jgi:ParB/RepB/Spo0J family partition protein
MTAVSTDRDRNRTSAPPTATPALPVGDPGELRRIPLSELIESPWNPRKHFDAEQLEDLADSLRKGQLAPIIVRPIAGKQERYEIGAGHRRYRAAPLAQLTSLLAIVRDLDDVAFLELLTIENKQREDIAPLDEAAGFRLLMEKAGYDVAKLAARIGLSTKYVYDRLKLLQLIPPAKKLLEQNVISAGHAIILARLSPSDQKRAIGNIEDVAEAGEYAAHRDSLLLRPDQAAEGDELPLHDQVKPVSVREFQQAVQEKIRARPEQLDPFLFPESAAALEVAKEEKLSVIHITREWRVDDEARDEKIKTYGSQAWERADGGIEEDYHTGRPAKSKTCAFSRYGFVVGPGQGEVFRVCINKQKCATHWPEQARKAKERAKRAKSSATTGSSQKRENIEAAAAAIEPPQDLQDQWHDEVAAAFAKSTFAPAVKKIIGQIKLADELLWNLAGAYIEIDGWSKVGKRGMYSFGDNLDDWIEKTIVPLLPGKLKAERSFTDVAGARSSLALRLWWARESRAANKLVEDACAARRVEWIAAEQARLKEQKLAKKPATKKAKKGGKR